MVDAGALLQSLHRKQHKEDKAEADEKKRRDEARRRSELPVYAPLQVCLRGGGGGGGGGGGKVAWVSKRARASVRV